MDALLLGAAVFLFGIWFFGFIVGTGFSRIFEQRPTEAATEPRPRSIRVTFPMRREVTLQRV
jgi:hypothetical protein